MSTSSRGRVVLFLGFVVGLTAAVQSDTLVSVLDSMVGIPWSEGIVIFLRNNTQGMIIFVLLGLFLELVGVRNNRQEPSDLAIQQLLETALKSSTSRALIAESLDNLYGENAGRQLVQTLFRDCYLIQKMNVSIRVVREANNYKVSVNLSYNTDADRFLIAVASTPSALEVALGTGLVMEGFISGDGAIPAIIQRIDVNPETGEKLTHELIFKELSKRARGKILPRSPSFADAVNLRFYEAIPADKAPIKAGHRYLYQISYTNYQPLEEDYTFWINDRVLHIDRIEVDLSALEGTAHNNAKIHKFLPSSQWSSEAVFSEGRCTLPLDTWVVMGQGFVVTWTGLRPEENNKQHLSNKEVDSKQLTTETKLCD